MQIITQVIKNIHVIRTFRQKKISDYILISIFILQKGRYKNL